MKGTNYTSIKVFLLAFSIRFLLILATPATNTITDLCIYIDSGQLMSHKINPYKLSEQPTIRNKLRKDSFAFNAYTCQNQAVWNYFASSNLPLALILFGLIDSISSTYLCYRLSFALFDSILALIIFSFIRNNWQKKIGSDWFSGQIMLGIFSPVLLQNGTIITEHKGTAILLILAAIQFTSSKNKFIREYLSACFVGSSIAFIGLGIFVLPLCLFHAFSWHYIEPLKSKLWTLLKYLLVAGFFTIIWFLPFWPDIFDMISNRIGGSTGLVAAKDNNWYPYFTAPYHSSPWRSVAIWFPNHWHIVRFIYLGIFIGINAYGICKKAINPWIITANLFILLLCFVLLDGSLDRINIGILIAILFLGKTNSEYAIVLSKFYFFGGILDLLISFFLKVIPSLKVSFLSDYKIFESLYFGVMFLTIYMYMLCKVIIDSKRYKMILK